MADASKKTGRRPGERLAEYQKRMKKDEAGRHQRGYVDPRAGGGGGGGGLAGLARRTRKGLEATTHDAAQEMARKGKGKKKKYADDHDDY